MKNLNRLNFFNQEGLGEESKLVFLSPGGPKRSPEKSREIQVTKEQKQLKEKLDNSVKAVSKQFLKSQPGKGPKEKAKNFMKKYENKPMGDMQRIDDIKSWLTNYQLPKGEKPFDPHSGGRASFYTREYANKLDSEISNLAYSPEKTKS
jgi:hypothetical protein